MNQVLLYEALEAERTFATMSAIFKGIDDKHCIEMQNLHAHKFNAAISKLKPLPINTANSLNRAETELAVSEMTNMGIAEQMVKQNYPNVISNSGTWPYLCTRRRQ